MTGGKGKTKGSVLVTGASRGLGKETALTLAGEGFRVWAGVRDTKSGSALEEEGRRRNAPLETVLLDVTDTASIDAAVAAILEKSGSLYALVNNAAITARAYFEDFPEEKIREIFEVNVFGAMNVTRRVLPHLREQRSGRIIMVSSIGGRIGAVAVAPYIASKFALEGFGECLSLEMKPLGVDVVIIEPGIVATDIWEEDKRILPQARNPEGPYFRWFSQAEEQAEKLLRTSPNRPAHVARKIFQALTVPRPRLRYVVGRRASLVLSLRRHLPGEWFEKIYFGAYLRRVTRNMADPA